MPHRNCLIRCTWREKLTLTRPYRPSRTGRYHWPGQKRPGFWRNSASIPGALPTDHRLRDAMGGDATDCQAANRASRAPRLRPRLVYIWVRDERREVSDWVAASAGQKTVYGRIGIWRRDDGQIGIRLGSGRGEISTVAASDHSARGNPHLYAKLRAILAAMDRWPLDADGTPIP